MNRLIIASVCAAGLLGVAACATQQTGAADYPRAEASAAATTGDDRFCLRYTGTRIDLTRHRRARELDQRCIAAGGRVYTREDLERTGEIDLANALRMLDPGIR